MSPSAQSVTPASCAERIKMKDTYESPLCSRYASSYMKHLFSPDMRYRTWRRLWTELARCEHELGLPVTEQQVKELEAHINDIDYDIVRNINMLRKSPFQIRLLRASLERQFSLIVAYMFITVHQTMN